MNARWLLVAVLTMASPFALDSAQSALRPSHSALRTAHFARQQPTFRGGADAISVDVVVKDGNRHVGGLGVADFELRDNGVRQTIERVDTTAVPIDVTLLVDVSGGTSGLPVTPRPRAEVDAGVNDARSTIAAMLRPDDRLRVMAVDEYLEPLSAMAVADASGPVGVRTYGGRAAIHDAIVAGLLREVEPERRHFVFAFTRAVDSLGTTNARSVADIAARSDAALFLVEQDAELLAEDSRQDCFCLGAMNCWPTVRFALPIQRRSPRPTACLENMPPQVDPQPRYGRNRLMLQSAAARTGGAVYDAGFFSTRNIVDVFRDIFDDFRRGYTLRYTAQGVRREGWHDITVTVPGHQDYTIRARPGYAVDAPRPPGRATSAAGDVPELTPERLSGAVTSANLPPQSVANAYGRGDFDLAGRALTSIRDFDRFVRTAREGGSLFPDSPRLDAVFALEAALAALTRPDESSQRASHEWLVDHTRFIRNPLGADTFECAWYWTVATGLIGRQLPELALPLLDNALERCPGTERLHLAKAVATDQRWPLGSTRPREGQTALTTPTNEHIKNVTERYRNAMSHGETAAEARTRLAWLLLRLNRPGDALDVMLTAGAGSNDPVVRYLEALVRGKILHALGRLDEAAAALATALDGWPRAQSARVALMHVELARGRRPAAEILAESVQAEPIDAAVTDPWWLYWQGDYRAWPAIVLNLRELAK